MFSTCTESRSSESYYQQPRIHEILHIKCPIIGLVRFQMNNMEYRLSESVDMVQRRKKWTYRLWRNRWTIISFIFMMLLMTSLFLYGTLVGAGLCSAGSWSPSYNSPCPKTFTFFPLLNTATSPRPPF
ncbi:uncharacterized protein LOC108914924 [Anoplophora glabripennis]|uniref:uncharacterized protein LOC108914924 n=1 Tax=Anoplophora glabripennis TaxID=217634 RepID=UPI000874383E|nr:uncharacterized protein LOC108914924 [Anoplophora glabripennis]